MWCENIIHQLVVWHWLQINRKRGGWIVTERPVLRWKDLQGLFDVCSAHTESYLTLLCPHRVLKIGSQLSFIFQCGSLLLHWIEGLQHRRASVSLFFCASAHLHFDFAPSSRECGSLTEYSVKKKKSFLSEAFYNSFAFLTLRLFFSYRCVNFPKKEGFFFFPSLWL